jgi:hypothetical protein
MNPHSKPEENEILEKRESSNVQVVMHMYPVAFDRPIRQWWHATIEGAVKLDDFCNTL